MKYCRQCITPDTRPNIILDADGVCNACRNNATKAEIDWNDRERAFRAVVRRARKLGRGRYDCLIPVSGGKDSHWQVLTCKKYGLNPLTVTWASPSRNDLGRLNLENLTKIGVDHIDYRINPEVEKRFMYAALEKLGSPAIPMHMALFSIPLRIAVDFDIPLIVWGENAAFEYGSRDKSDEGLELNKAWFLRYGVTAGTTADDWVADGLTRQALTPYCRPDDQRLAKSATKAVFLGYYFRWDPQTSLDAAVKAGFKPRADGPKTGLYNYADIDDDFISIHHYLKWYKFGFTRLFDNLSIEIRNKRITREKALDIVAAAGPQTPHDDIESLCRYLDITADHFFKLIEKFRNRDIWSRKQGTWYIPDFIIPEWSWT